MKTLVILSGGMDSTALLWKRKELGDELLAVSFLYGQRHRREIAMAAEQCRLADCGHIVTEIAGLFPQDESALTGGGDIPHGHYADENMKKTVVPARNLIMIAMGAQIAISNGCDGLAVGVHSGDHEIYPDCRPDFIRPMMDAIKSCDYHPLTLLAPFLHSDKERILKTTSHLGIDWGKTHTCYEGGEIGCGRCGSCVERREAFLNAGMTDPLTYSDDAYEFQEDSNGRYKVQIPN